MFNIIKHRKSITTEIVSTLNHYKKIEPALKSRISGAATVAQGVDAPVAWAKWATLVLISILLHGCGTLPNGRGWGQDVTVQPGWGTVAGAAWNAAVSPAVWLPVAGALALNFENFDRRITDWAGMQNPVFGSQEDAAFQSDHFRDYATVAYALTVLGTPSGAEPGKWLENKGKGAAVQYMAIRLTKICTSHLKDAFPRETPNGHMFDSALSGHCANAAVLTTLSLRNLRTIPIRPELRLGAKAIVYGLEFGTSWARVEAYEHRPSEVLLSMSLGNFIGAFMEEAFMGLNENQRVRPEVAIGTAFVFIGFHVKF